MTNRFSEAESQGYGTDTAEPVGGCVLFDNRSNPEAGWASLAGATAERIRGVGDLNSSVTWVSNLSYSEYRNENQGGRIRSSSFLRVEISRLAWDMGYDLRDNASEAAEFLGELVNRVCSLAKKNYGVEYFGATLAETIAGKILTPAMDPPLPVEARRAVEQAYHALQRCPGGQVRGQRILSFQWPPQVFTRVIMSFPVPSGTWSRRRKNLPKTRADTQSLLFELGNERSGFARIDVKGVPPEVSNLLEFTQGNRGVREWVPLPEAAHLTIFGTVTIKELILSEACKVPNQQKRWMLPEFGIAGDLSLSVGIISEAHWVALANHQRIHRHGRRERIVSARAAVMRAWDRLLCMRAAADFQAAGFQVCSYGVGTVNLFGRSEEMSRAIEVAERLKINSSLAVIIDSEKNNSGMVPSPGWDKEEEQF